MTRPIIFSEGEFYHIYNRGNDRRKIFLSPRDYERFIILLHLCNSENSVHISLHSKTTSELLDLPTEKSLIDIGAWVLMPNHFHLLVYEKTEKGLSRFMQKLTTGYTMYFNKKNDRSGSLFQGVFKAEHANQDNYLKYLFAYIHLNPIKLIDSEWLENGIDDRKKADEFLKSFHYSSYTEYTGKNRKENIILNKNAFPEYFESIQSFEEMIKFWLEFKDN